MRGGSWRAARNGACPPAPTPPRRPRRAPSPARAPAGRENGPRRSPQSRGARIPPHGGPVRSTDPTPRPRSRRPSPIAGSPGPGPRPPAPRETRTGTVRARETRPQTTPYLQGKTESPVAPKVCALRRPASSGTNQHVGRARAACLLARSVAALRVRNRMLDTPSRPTEEFPEGHEPIVVSPAPAFEVAAVAVSAPPKKTKPVHR